MCSSDLIFKSSGSKKVPKDVKPLIVGKADGDNMTLVFTPTLGSCQWYSVTVGSGQFWSSSTTVASIVCWCGHLSRSWSGIRLLRGNC